MFLSILEALTRKLPFMTVSTGQTNDAEPFNQSLLATTFGIRDIWTFVTHAILKGDPLVLQ